MLSNYDNINHKIIERRANTERRRFDDFNYKGVERRITKDRRKNGQNRKHKRYRVKDLSYVKLGPESNVDIGQILDISEGGLSFQHVADAEKLKNYSTFDISTIVNDFFPINRIPFKSISDIELANASPFSLKKLRRHSLKFVNLTSRQLFKIKHFILNYTS